MLPQANQKKRKEKLATRSIDSNALLIDDERLLNISVSMYKSFAMSKSHQKKKKWKK